MVSSKSIKITYPNLKGTFEKILSNTWDIFTMPYSKFINKKDISFKVFSIIYNRELAMLVAPTLLGFDIEPMLISRIVHPTL